MHCKLTHFFLCSIVNLNMNCEIKGQYYNTIEINWTLQHQTSYFNITQSYKVKGNKTIFILTAYVKFVLMVEPHFVHTQSISKYISSTLYEKNKLNKMCKTKPHIPMS